MRAQLAKYVELLFAGTTGTYDMQQEILQNSLDRFDDLVAQGKTPEAAYRLTICGIGDINEILGQQPPVPTPPPMPTPPPVSEPIMATAPVQETPDTKRKLLRSIAIALYILSAIPVVFSDGSSLGVCLTVTIVAIATAIMVFIGKSTPDHTSQNAASFPPPKPKSRGRGIAKAIIWPCGICIYITVSILTNGWHITWIIFLMLACIQNIINAAFDLKEACKK